MKVTDVQVIRADRYGYVKVITDEGIYGIGESGAFGVLEASAAQIKTYGDYLI